ncbi:AI-2E family transporter [Anderseniella sp. Alg231-50]|uniref:AI-2E family transporter n=1 Tax=Anderseniella sp. Alg231-50 TaxID=1922226 RepID=UPI000D54FEC1
MTVQRQVSVWLIVLGAFIAFMWLFADIMLPFIAGIVLAYFLDPVADALERLKLPRLAATLVIVLTSIFVLVLVLLLVVPLIGDQIGKFAERLPSNVSTLVTLFNDLAPVWLKEALAKTSSTLPASGSDIAAKAAVWIASLLQSILTGGLALFNLMSLLIITPLVTFYMLNDWDRMVERIDGWVPRDHVDTVRGVARDINAAMAGFIRGQGTVCMLLGIFYAVALISAGLNFGLLIGLTAGLLSFIPFVGAAIGGILAIATALVQFWPDWVQILIIAGIFGFGQFIEGNFLSPKLVGQSIGVHPVWLMFALLAFGYLFGFAGILLAVPLAAAIGVLSRFFLNKYLGSKLYLGVRKRRQPAPPKGG